MIKTKLSNRTKSVRGALETIILEIKMELNNLTDKGYVETHSSNQVKKKMVESYKKGISKMMTIIPTEDNKDEYSEYLIFYKELLEDIEIISSQIQYNNTKPITVERCDTHIRRVLASIHHEIYVQLKDFKLVIPTNINFI